MGKASVPVGHATLRGGPPQPVVRGLIELSITRFLCGARFGWSRRQVPSVGEMDKHHLVSIRSKRRWRSGI